MKSPAPRHAADFHLELGTEPGIFQQSYETGTYFLSSRLYS